MIETPFRAGAILIELCIIAVVNYALFLGLRLALLDLGLNPKYESFIRTTLTTVWILVMVFFVSHLIPFYPGIFP